MFLSIGTMEILDDNRTLKLLEMMFTRLSRSLWGCIRRAMRERVVELLGKITFLFFRTLSYYAWIWFSLILRWIRMSG